MARIRTIKPEFFTSAQIAECSTSARLAFVGMWCFCDDNGIHPASAKRLKMEVFPGDDISESGVQSFIDELINNDLLIEFVHEKQAFWCVTGFKRHQKIDRPNPKYPTPDSPGSTTARRTFVEHSTSGSGQVAESSASDHPRKGMEGSLRELPCGNSLSGTGEKNSSPPPPSVAEPYSPETTAASERCEAIDANSSETGQMSQKNVTSTQQKQKSLGRSKRSEADIGPLIDSMTITDIERYVGSDRSLIERLRVKGWSRAKNPSDRQLLIEVVGDSQGAA